MRKVYRPLLVMHPDASFRDRVRQASGDDYQWKELPDWDALQEAIRQSPPAALVLVSPYAESARGRRQTLAPALQELLAAYPSTAVLAAMEVSPDRHEELRTLGRWGVVQLISLGHDDTPPAIARRLRAARGRPMRSLLEQTLPPEMSGRGRAIIDAAADVVMAGEHGRDLAATLRLSRRTLLRWCQRAGIPAPRQLLAWMRILLACALLDDPGRTVASVAQSCGYSSDSGLRRVTQKFLRASPTELREQGAFRRAAAAFLDAVEEARGRVRITTREV